MRNLSWNEEFESSLSLSLSSLLSLMCVCSPLDQNSAGVEDLFHTGSSTSAAGVEEGAGVEEVFYTSSSTPAPLLAGVGYFRWPGCRS